MSFYGELQQSPASAACNDGKAPGHGETLGHPGCVAGSYVARCP